MQNILKTSENDIEDNTTEEILNNTIYIENTTLKKSLNINEIYTIDFSTDSVIELNLTSSWVLYYEYNLGSWILKNNSTSLNTTINAGNNLKLTNYSWYISFELSSDNKFDIDEKKYKIIETIWNKEVVKSMWIIK